MNLIVDLFTLALGNLCVNILACKKCGDEFTSFKSEGHVPCIFYTHELKQVLLSCLSSHHRPAPSHFIKMQLKTHCVYFEYYGKSMDIIFCLSIVMS